MPSKQQCQKYWRILNAQTFNQGQSSISLVLSSPNEEGFAQTTRSALSQRGLLDPIKPAYNQSRPDGRLRFTASAFNRLWISMPAVLVAVPVATQNSLHPLLTSSNTARHLLDFMVQGKITKGDAQTIHLGALPPSSPHFYAECSFCHNPPNLSWLGRDTELWLAYPVAWLTDSIFMHHKGVTFCSFLSL